MKIKEKSNCKYDLISLGEVMLRMDPGEGRIRTARSFKVCEGGGEYNVVRALLINGVFCLWTFRTPTS